MELALYFIFSIPLGLYLLLFFRAGSSLYRNPLLSDNFQGKIAVLIPFKNEWQHLPRLIECLNKQSIRNHIQWIFIDDFSSDGGFDFLKNHPSQNIKLIQNRGKAGKKHALSEAIVNCDADVFVCTDADCLPSENWLAQLSAVFCNPDIQMNCGLVLPSNTNKDYIFGIIEFISLIASTHAFAHLGMPFMCNGASLAFRKTAFESVGGYNENQNIASGDDVFLLHKIKKAFGTKSISYTSSVGSEVYTEMPKAYKDFLVQRSRWGGKASHYQDSFALFMAILVLALCVLQAVSLGLIFTVYWPIPLFLWIGKLGMDYWFLSKAFSLYQITTKPIQLLLAGLRYPFYIIHTVLLIFTKKNKSWK